MLTIAIAIVFLVVLIAEFWLGIAVTGWEGDRLFLERSNTPGPYWMVMALHTTISIVVPALAFAAGL